MTASPFDEVKAALDHVMEFQLGDIFKSLKAPCNANFLAAQGAMVCTEFLGGIFEGTLATSGVARPRFEAGVGLLAQVEVQYAGAATELRKLRNGFLHSYLPKGKPGRYILVANDPNSQVGFSLRKDPATGREELILNVPTYARHLGAAYAFLLESLQADSQRLQRAKRCLEKLPGLA